MPPRSLPGPAAGRLGRSSLDRFLLDWNAADGLDDLGRLVARTGQVGTFSRGGTVGAASTIDANGVAHLAASQQPRFYHSYDSTTGLFLPRGIILEGARQNLVTNGLTPTTANGFIAGGTLTSIVTSTYAGLAFARVANATAGNLYRSLTFTGDAVKGFSFALRADAAVTGTVILWLYDVTATTIRAAVTCTIAAGGAITAVAGTGTLLRTERMADGVYRFHVASSAITAANTHEVYVCSGTGSAASYLVAAVHAENAASPSSIIPNGASLLTRSADTGNFTFNAVPQALTLYVKLLEMGSLWNGTNGRALAIGDPGSNNSFYLIPSGIGGVWRAAHKTAAGTLTSTAAAAAAVGDVVELRAVLAADGSVTLGQSLNGGTEAVAAPSAANALQSAWNAPFVYVNGESGAPGYAAYSAVKIAAGSKTLAQMRAA